MEGLKEEAKALSMEDIQKLIAAQLFFQNFMVTIWTILHIQGAIVICLLLALLNLI